ncbi:hypothetical protein MMC13_001265 [Lambiella insularis]|nr:hypothetical protein [Lambiella insularis]
MAERPPKDLRPLSRFITTHDGEDKAIFSAQIPPVVPLNSSGTVARMSRTSATTKQATKTPPGITIPNGNVARIVVYSTTH